MDWLLDSLRVVREVRDWATARTRRDSSALATQSALEKAAKDLESVVLDNGVELPALIERVDASEHMVEPLGPEEPVSRSRGRGRSERRPRGDEGGDGDGAQGLESDGVASRADQRIQNEDIDPQAISATRRLRRYGYKAYLVGGCVRDLLLGIPPKDFDIATDARPEEVKAVFRNSRIIGRRFRLVHLYYRGGKVLEVATFRAAAPPEEDEDANGDLLIRRDNVFGSEQEDAQRRDFTINALFYDPESGRIIDHVEGLADIDARIVRMIGDPDIRLREDPVRIVRAIRFRAKAGLTIEPELEAALARHVEDLVRCPPARLLEETLKLLRMGHALASYDEMQKHGVLNVLLPEVQAFVAGHLSLLAGAEVMEDRDPVTEIRSYLQALDDVVARAPVADDVVLGALLYPMADAVMAHADSQGRDRNKLLAELLGEVGTRIQFTRKLSEQLRQCFGVQRHFPSEGSGSGGRRRRRMSPTTLIRRGSFPSALRLFEIHQRATGGDLEEVKAWESRAKNEGVPVGSLLSSARNGLPTVATGEGNDDGALKKRRRRSGRRRRRPQPADS